MFDLIINNICCVSSLNPPNEMVRHVIILLFFLPTLLFGQTKTKIDSAKGDTAAYFAVGSKATKKNCIDNPNIGK